MMSVGETLRRERIKRNLAFDEISRELKISARFLEAIEDEDFHKLPGGVFARAFVRQYGSLLGLNGEELAAQLQQTLEPAPVEVTPPPRRVRTGLVPIQVPRMEEWQSVGDRPFRWSGSLSAAIVVVVVMLVCSGVYTWLQHPRNPISAAAPAQSKPAQSAPAQPAPVPQPAPVAAAPEPVQQAPSQAGAPPATAPQSPGPNPNANVHVEITAGEPVWILARSDGKFAFTGTMQVNETRTVDAVNDVVLRLGNAGAAAIMLNGKSIGPVGPRGQVRTVQFTSGGFQIVPVVKPPSDPAAPIVRL